MLEQVPDLTQMSGWLPLVFALVMALAMLAYVIMDGYDLGVGVLMRYADDKQKDVMIASIGPFWDANETWLVLGVGVLLVAFPLAHGAVLGALYLPAALMLMALMLRGVAFDFRVKAREEHKRLWDNAFNIGSLLAAWAQGYMLGALVTGFRNDLWGWLFGALIGFCLIAAYCLMGAGWLIMKTEGELQLRAVAWATRSVWLAAGGIGAISIVTPLVSANIFQKWFSFPNIVLLSPVPVATLVLFAVILRSLLRLPKRLKENNEYGIGVPFLGTVGVFILASYGLGYSLFPWLVVDKLTIWSAASATESLLFIFWGVAVVLPMIIGYTVYSYRVFWGKSAALEY